MGAKATKPMLHQQQHLDPRVGHGRGVITREQRPMYPHHDPHLMPSSHQQQPHSSSNNRDPRHQSSSGPVTRTIANGIPPKPTRQMAAEHGGAENSRSHQHAASSKSSGYGSSYRVAANGSAVLLASTTVVASQHNTSHSVSPIYRRMPTAKHPTKSTLIQELLECPVCMNLFESPHVLPCQHTFCKACINSMFNAAVKTLDCPMCRVKHALPNGVESLTANFTIQRLIELESMESPVVEVLPAPPAAVIVESRSSPESKSSSSRRHHDSSSNSSSSSSSRSAKAKCFACQRFTRLRVCRDCSYMLCYDCVENPDHDYIIGDSRSEFFFIFKRAVLET
jgi:hypothetical protein